MVEKEIDHVYSVYFSENSTMLDDKYFDEDTNDFVIVDRVKYKSTHDLYELFFKKIPDDTIYTKGDKLAYKKRYTVGNECSQAMRSHKANNLIVDSKGYKYKNIIASLGSGKI